jgi:hypothetical protein
MKIIVKTVLLFLLVKPCFCQSWTREQTDLANTAKNVKYLSPEEKDAIMYINLARLFPKLFVKYELINYKGINGDDYDSDPSYKLSLIKDLNRMVPVNALSFDAVLYNSAKCLAIESVESNKMTHTRKKCPQIPFRGRVGECVAEGFDTGKDLAMGWLIDNGEKDLGHRIICLSGSYTNIGVSAQKKSGDTFSVADLNDGE